MGKFGSATWTLVGVVCDECNSYFGDNLEVNFNRGSLEAVHRFEHGLKSKDEAGDIHASRMSVVSVSKQSEGMKFAPVSHQRLPQIGFLLAGSESKRDFFTLAELEAMKLIEKAKYDLKNPKGIWASADTQDHFDRLCSALARLGIPFVRKDGAAPIGPHQIQLEYRVKIDQVILRTVAKIAFNYMAKVRSAQYCLRSDFDAIRAFIRFATPPPFTAIVPTNLPILGYDTETKRQLAGHLIVLETKGSGATVQARVSFFNGVTYLITLAKFSTAAVLPDVGYHFDFKKKKINRLGQGAKQYRFF